MLALVTTRGIKFIKIGKSGLQDCFYQLMSQLPFQVSPSGIKTDKFPGKTQLE